MHQPTTTAVQVFDGSKFKLYRGTLTLKAWPITRGQYHRYRGWGEPDHPEDAYEPGYLVEYIVGEHGGDDRRNVQNHPNHTGFISWLPKAAFEAVYEEVI